jgi:DNA-binding MarR family transcriptional regulator
MSETEDRLPWHEAVSIPVLLRHARTAYGAAMRKALEAADFGDVPANGMYVIGGMARGEGSLSLTQLVGELGVSKQAAGQLVDTLVLRGYLQRAVDEEDRRKISITLTPRGFAAAEAQMAGRMQVDEKLVACVGAECVSQMRRGLAVLCSFSQEEAPESQAAETHAASA